MSARSLLRLALWLTALTALPLAAQEGDDTPASLLAMLESAAGLNAAAPRLLDPSASDATLRLLAQSVPTQAAALQAGVVQVYALIRGANAPPGSQPALAGAAAFAADTQPDVLSQVVQYASDLDASRSELAALVANGRSPDPSLPQALSDLQAKLADLLSELGCLVRLL